MQPDIPRDRTGTYGVEDRAEEQCRHRRSRVGVLADAAPGNDLSRVESTDMTAAPPT